MTHILLHLSILLHFPIYWIEFVDMFLEKYLNLSINNQYIQNNYNSYINNKVTFISY